MTQDGMKHRKDVMPRPWDKSNYTEYYDLMRKAETLTNVTDPHLVGLIDYNSNNNETPTNGSSSTR